MNIEQGMKLVISGGIITPDIKKKIKKNYPAESKFVAAVFF